MVYLYIISINNGKSSPIKRNFHERQLLFLKVFTLIPRYRLVFIFISSF